MQIIKSASVSTIMPDFVGSVETPIAESVGIHAAEPEDVPTGVPYMSDLACKPWVGICINPAVPALFCKPSVIPLPITCPVYADLFGKLNVGLWYQKNIKFHGNGI